MRVCIIGAGWYGCHAAILFLEHGDSVQLLDKTGIFSGASANNQNRLHLGYHYPRSPNTIEECQKGNSQFIARYGYGVVDFSKNYYFLHKDSVTPIDTYRKVFGGFGHEELAISDIGMKTCGLQGSVFVVKEKFIDSRIYQSYMHDALAQYLEISSSPNIERYGESRFLVNGNEYDYVLNCTNNQYIPIPVPFSPTYERFCSFIYRLNDEEGLLGLTVMDGPFFSMFPYDPETHTYTLTHVVHGVLSRGTSIEDDPSAERIADARIKTEIDMFTTFPELASRISYVGYFLSIKTKYDFIEDDRSVRIHHDGNYLSVSGGKITGIFELETCLRKTFLCSPDTGLASRAISSQNMSPEFDL